MGQPAGCRVAQSAGLLPTTIYGQVGVALQVGVCCGSPVPHLPTRGSSPPAAHCKYGSYGSSRSISPLVLTMPLLLLLRRCSIDSLQQLLRTGLSSSHVILRGFAPRARKGSRALPARRPECPG